VRPGLIRGIEHVQIYAVIGKEAVKKSPRVIYGVHLGRNQVGIFASKFIGVEVDLQLCLVLAALIDLSRFLPGVQKGWSKAAGGGVRLLRLDDDDSVAAAAVLQEEDEEEKK